MKENKRSIIPGILLVMIGLWMLSRDVIPAYGVWEHIYPLIILSFAGFHFIEWARTKRQNTFFRGVFFLLAGVFFTLRNFDWIPYLYIDEYWPVFLVFWGVGYLARFILHPDDWSVLIPAMLFVSLGAFFFLHTAGDILGRPGFEIEKYWPAGLIVIGFGLLISAFFKSIKNKSGHG